MNNKFIGTKSEYDVFEDIQTAKNNTKKINKALEKKIRNIKRLKNKIKKDKL